MNDAYDVGLLILRLVLGLTLAAHGYNKFFGGGRIPGTARWFESIGMKYGTFQAVVAATTEIAAGLGCVERTVERKLERIRARWTGSEGGAAGGEHATAGPAR